jgi:mRNA interferase MazF
VDLVSRPRQFDVYLVGLEPVVGCEISKTRPCLIVSPDEMNRNLRTAIIAPLTTTFRRYPTRVDLQFQGKQGQIALDQLRSVDKSRLVKPLGFIDSATRGLVLTTLREIFTQRAYSQSLSRDLSIWKLHEPTRPSYQVQQVANSSCESVFSNPQ